MDRIDTIVNRCFVSGVLNHRILLFVNNKSGTLKLNRLSKMTRSDPRTYTDVPVDRLVDHLLPDSTLLDRDEVPQRVGGRPFRSEKEHRILHKESSSLWAEIRR